jgi:hypothetical protein
MAQSLATGGMRSDVVAKRGRPNAAQGEGAAGEDVCASYPDGLKFTFSSRKSKLLLGQLYTKGILGPLGSNPSKGSPMRPAKGFNEVMTASRVLLTMMWSE